MKDKDKKPAAGQGEIRWEEVATTSGIMQAQILAGRLQSEGIPARAWQESVGQTTGLVVGPLGMGHVLVPEAYVEQALAILADVDESVAEDDENSWLEA
jgi:hypothetical protein